MCVFCSFVDDHAIRGHCFWTFKESFTHEQYLLSRKPRGGLKTWSSIPAEKCCQTHLLEHMSCRLALQILSLPHFTSLSDTSATICHAYTPNTAEWLMRTYDNRRDIAKAAFSKVYQFSPFIFWKTMFAFSDPAETLNTEVGLSHDPAEKLGWETVFSKPPAGPFRSTVLLPATSYQRLLSRHWRPSAALQSSERGALLSPRPRPASLPALGPLALRSSPCDVRGWIAPEGSYYKGHPLFSGTAFGHRLELFQAQLLAFLRDIHDHLCSPPVRMTSS